MCTKSSVIAQKTGHATLDNTMNKTSILFLTLFLFSSCLAIESKLAEQDPSQEKKAAGRPFTKSAVCAVGTFIS